MSRRAVELLVGFFALLGFVSVPIGERTGLEHARAILSTSAASEAFRSLFETSQRMGNRVIGGAFERGPSTDTRSAESDPQGTGHASGGGSGTGQPLRPPSNSARSPRHASAAPNECAPYTSFTWPGSQQALEAL